MIKRTKYLNQLIALKNNGFPKVITGPRRTGKSYLLHEIFTDYLIEKDTFNKLGYKAKINTHTTSYIN